MAWGRAALVVAVAVVVVVPLVSGGPRDEAFRLGSDPSWLAQARPLGPSAPPWARRMYRRSLLVLRAMTNPETGAVVAGRRDGWEYVWPRDASAVAIALASAGYRDEAQRVVRFLLGLDLEAAARFHADGTPVEGRNAQGDAAGWVRVAAKAVGIEARVVPEPWRDRADYQEGGSGDYLGNAIASTAGEPKGIPAGDLSVRRPADREIRRDFGATGVLVREAGDPESGLDSAAAWAVRPFPHPALYPLARLTLLRIAAESGHYGIVPSEDWDGGIDPWTAPTAWTAWSLAALGERHAALHLMMELRRDETPDGFLPERVDARTGLPTSTTPLAWSHAFAILAIRQLWPGRAVPQGPKKAPEGRHVTEG
jgi:glucoamylase